MRELTGVERELSADGLAVVLTHEGELEPGDRLLIPFAVERGAKILGVKRPRGN